MVLSARPRESGDPGAKELDSRLRGNERKQRAVKLCPAEVRMDRQADGTGAGERSGR